MIIFLFLITFLASTKDSSSLKPRDVSSQSSLIENLKKIISIQEGSYSADNDDNESCPAGELSLSLVDDSIAVRIDEKVLISDIKGEKNVLSFKESGCQHNITVVVEKNVITRTKQQICKKDNYSFINQLTVDGDKIVQTAESKKNNVVTLKVRCVLLRQK